MTLSGQSATDPITVTRAFLENVRTALLSCNVIYGGLIDSITQKLAGEAEHDYVLVELYADELDELTKEGPEPIGYPTYEKLVAGREAIRRRLGA